MSGDEHESLNRPCIKSNNNGEKTRSGTISFTHKLRTNSVYRRKLVLTSAVFWSYVTLGWVIMQVGAALPDIQAIVDIDLETASWLFTTWSLGYLTGSLFCGFLYDRVNRLVLMCVCTVGVTICMACFAYSETFVVMIVLRVLIGIFCGGVDTGANTIVPSIWGAKCGPFMQALYFSYTLGSIASPLATERFLSFSGRKNHSPATVKFVNDIDTNTSFATITNYTNVSLGYSDNHNDGTLLQKQFTEFEDVTRVSTNESLGGLSDGRFSSNICDAFLITSVLVGSSAIPYLVMALLGNFDFKASPKPVDNAAKKHELKALEEKANISVIKETRTTQIKGKRKYVILACIAGVNLLYSATEDSLSGYIVTFALNFLGWSSSFSVWLISLYWIASCIGGLAGVILVRLLRPAKLLFAAHTLWIASFLLSLIASYFRINEMIWIFIPISGISMVLIIPTAISWTEANVCHVTGRVSSLFMIATGTGIAANPSIIGFLMEKYSYVFLIFILSIEAVICFVLYSLAFFVRNFRQNSQPAENVKVYINT